MRRTYTVEHYRERIAHIRANIQGVTLATDIIVGFPGEADEQFDNTLHLLNDLEFDKVHVAMYSPRPGTLSARWTDDIPAEVKHARHQAVERIQERVSAAKLRARIGDTVEVLVDGRQRGRWRGRTRGNTLVFFDAPGEWLGQLINVKIDSAMTWYLLGEPVSIASHAEPAYV
jgi:tRNA-2-methylthio-N6-dimethylallyladenosine synthase